MDSPAPPPTPDYAGAAKETAAGNLANLNAQTAANRVNQVTPWGSSTWTQGAPTTSFNQAGYDAALAAYNQQAASNSNGYDYYDDNGWKNHYAGSDPVGPAPTRDQFTTSTGGGDWKQTISLTPEMQEALNAQNAIQSNQSKLAQQLQGQVSSTMAGGFHGPDLKSYMAGVNGVKQDFGGFNYGGAGTDTNYLNQGYFTQGNQAVSQNLNSSAQQLDQNFQFGPVNQSFDSTGRNLNTNFQSGAQGINTNFQTGAQGVNTNFQSGGQGVHTNFQSGAQGVNTNFQSGAQGLNQNFQSQAQRLNANFQSGAQGLNTDAAGAVANAGQVDINAPQWTDGMSREAAQAAYHAQMDLMHPQMEQDTSNLDAKLRLQGLTPGTESYNNAYQNLARVQGQVSTQAANQSVLTGNQIANSNYASALAGYGAKNSAQNQSYNQSANTFQLGNAARQAQYGQDANTFALNQNATGQQFSQDLAGFNANNSARQAQFGQDATQFQLKNAAIGQQFGQDQAAFNTRNTALGQQFSQDQSAFNTRNAAIGQQFGQDASRFSMNNAALGQQFGQDNAAFNTNNAAKAAQYGQDANYFAAQNQAQQQQYAQSLGAYGANNASRTQQLQNDQATFAANNNARTQAQQNSLAQYQSALTGQSAYNQAQQQSYNQALAGYGANQSAQQNANQAQAQAFQQAQQGYGTAYSAAMQNYLQPLNSMNAVLTGNQVQMPNMPSYSQAGYVPGADMAGATNALGSWNQGLYNAQSSSSSALTGSIIGAGATIGAAFL